MCTIKLSYDQKNAEARQMLESLFKTGLFVLLEGDDSLVIDYSDPWLYEDHDDLPPLAEGKDTFTLEEFREILLDDIRKIYNEQDEEVSVCH
ncbi:MAG: hypothetical protein IJ142_01945 [Bacteroidaceae bacterium]|nr:hypothetical protein [Bacteroidaceae bacterium]